MPVRCLPVAPPKDVAKTKTPVKYPGVGLHDGWIMDQNGAWKKLETMKEQTQEELEIQRAYDEREQSASWRNTVATQQPAPPNNNPHHSSYVSHRPVNHIPAVTTTPKTHYISTADFRYSHWRRIEDTRTIYSMSGIKLSSASKYRVELVKYLEDKKEQTEALLQLLDATIEYGFIAPEPCTERWIDTDDDYLLYLQHCRIDLYNLFAHHNLLEHKEIKERQFIWEYLNTSADNVEQSIELIAELMTEYTYGMFDPEKKTRYNHGSYSSRKKKKKEKALTKRNKSNKVKNSKEDNSNATVH